MIRRALLAVVACSSAPSPTPAPTPAPPVTPAPVVARGREIVATTLQACARTRAGTIACWGEDAAKSEVGIDHVVGLAFGGADSCAWRDDGSVWCQGLLAADHAWRAVAGIDHVVELAGDDALFCARRASGEVACWQHAFDTPENKAAPPTFTPLAIADAVEIAVARDVGCARHQTGEVTCWTGSAPSAFVTVGAARGATSLAGGSVEHVAGGGEPRFAAVLPGGRATGWLGDDKATAWTVPALPPGTTRFALGSDGACAIGQTVTCWEYDLFKHTVTKPHEIPGTAGMTDVAVGQDVICGRTHDDRVACWGAREALGTGTPRLVTTPTDVPGLDDAVQIATNAHQTCARRKSGAIACFAADPPVDVPGITDAVDVAMIDSLACARTKGDKLACWTYDEQGTPSPVRAGKPDEFPEPDAWSSSVTRTSWSCSRTGKRFHCSYKWAGRHVDDAEEGDLPELATALDKLGDIVQMQFHASHLYARTAKGQLFVRDLEGQAMDLMFDDVVALSHGAEATLNGEPICAVRKSGEVTCWNNDDVDKRTTVPGVSDARGMAGADYHACVVKASGRVACWGDRERLGVGDHRTVQAATKIDGVDL